MKTDYTNLPSAIASRGYRADAVVRVETRHGSDDPWEGFELTAPPESASREQLFEFGALLGVLEHCRHCERITPAAKGIVTAYLQRWHPAMQVPKAS